MNLTTNKQKRKEMPITRGVLDYFPNAIAEVARVSYIGNQQHNPGEELHWSREKSSDHMDCISRHLIDRGKLDDDGMRHTAKLAWRALALLQLELEANQQQYEETHGNDNCRDGRTIAQQKRGAQLKKDQEAVAKAKDGDCVEVSEAYLEAIQRYPYSLYPMMNMLLRAGVPTAIAKQIYGGTTFPARDGVAKGRSIYIAGPMRGHKAFNFPAFDAERDRLSADGWTVISPADIDRTAGDVSAGKLPPQHVFVLRDFFAIYFIATQTENGAIGMLRGWRKSRGATAEHYLAEWLGLTVLELGGKY